MQIQKEQDIPKGSVLAALQQRIQPNHSGWIDEYKAVLYALGIDPCMSFTDLRNKLK